MKKKTKEKKLSLIQKYRLYEIAVQSPDHDVPWVISTYRNIYNKDPRVMREDFCGTFSLACEWVKAKKGNRALVLDLDPEPLELGRKTHYSKLTSAQKKNIKILKQNVLSVTTPKADVVMAYNFSFFIFKERKQLIDYFRACYDSLQNEGIIVFEIAGGPGMIEEVKERKTLRDGKGNFLCYYFWDQKSFNPITAEAKYAIHFKFKDGSMATDAFTYDWRVWTLPEMRDALAEAGFQESRVYCEHTNKKSRTTEYLPTTKADNDWSWVSYLVAMKRSP